MALPEDDEDRMDNDGDADDEGDLFADMPAEDDVAGDEEDIAADEEDVMEDEGDLAEDEGDLLGDEEDLMGDEEGDLIEPGQEGETMELLHELAGLLESREDIVIDTGRIVDSDDFLRHLITGLKTKAAASGEEYDEYPEESGAGGEEGETPREEPQMITMSAAVRRHLTSRDQQVARLEQQLAADRHRNLSREIDTLVTEGRATPHDRQQWQKLLAAPAVKMSLCGNSQNSTLAAVLSQISYAGRIPKGTFWSKDQKTRAQAKRVRMSTMAQPPDGLYGHEIDPDKQKDVIAEMAERAGAPPEVVAYVRKNGAPRSKFS